MNSIDERLSALMSAMEIELNGITLYRNTAIQTEDIHAREVFKFLADEEVKHYRALRDIYESIVKGEAIKYELKGERPSFKKIFSDEFRQKLQGKNIEFSAISTGLILEKNSVEFYREQKEKSTMDELKRLYSELESWETVHYNMLLGEYNDLKALFWEANQFYPF